MTTNDQLKLDVAFVAENLKVEEECPDKVWANDTGTICHHPEHGYSGTSTRYPMRMECPGKEFVRRQANGANLGDEDFALAQLHNNELSKCVCHGKGWAPCDNGMVLLRTLRDHGVDFTLSSGDDYGFPVYYAHVVDGDKTYRASMLITPEAAIFAATREYVKGRSNHD